MVSLSRNLLGLCTFIWAKSAFGCGKGSDMIKDTIGMLFVTGFVIAFGTNAVTTDYNIWALMARFGG